MAYTVGRSKVLRQVTHGNERCPNRTKQISRDNDRPSRSHVAKEKRSGGSANRLSEQEHKELERASKRGYVTLEGTGYRRGRKGSAVANTHREWCDSRSKPQIILCKASGGRPLDNVIIDLSPLRLGTLSEDMSFVDEFLIRWKAEILTAAEGAGMFLNSEYVEDNCESLDLNQEEQDEHSATKFFMAIDSDSWVTQPIWRLPAISMGVFEGERSQAKAMARELAQLWDTMEREKPEVFETKSKNIPKKKRRNGDRRGGNMKIKGLREHRRKDRRRSEEFW